MSAILSGFWQPRGCWPVFEVDAMPRVFGLPPGADFPAELAQGILSRMEGRSPEEMARVTVLVNTRRMQRRLKDILAEGDARLLPRIGLVTDLDALLPDADLPPPVTSLRRRLELSSMIAKLIDAEPDLAPRSAIVDLAESLAALMDEMQGEDVSAETIATLEIDDQSGHWARSLRFLSIVSQYTKATADQWLDPEARRRFAAQRLVESWEENPPANPVIVAGSTASRATTSLIMEAVARLPQGALVLPGFDFDLPSRVFAELDSSTLTPLGSEDHPQYRFARLLGALRLEKKDVQRWSGADDQKDRNTLISLSLRPAPVTHQWLEEGPDLGDLEPRTREIALIEAQDPKSEALAIAIALRQAVQNGQTAALITTDRTLGRRVTAALSRWDIIPDDSAGRPLSLTAPGRFLRQVSGMIGQQSDPVDLISLLKHPLAYSGQADRGMHLRLTRELELFLRRNNTVIVSQQVVEAFRKTVRPQEQVWCDWLSNWLADAAARPLSTLADCLDRHIAAAERLASGDRVGSGQLWERTAGRDTLKLIETFRAEADFEGHLPFSEYVRLLDRRLSAESTRNYDTARSDVMIWGTLEARVQGAELVILGGLNEGTWPERPTPDPWLNRPLRRRAGLLLPDRQIGLSAHDFQQAIAARQVILSRAKRDGDSETVPSRWLSRLTNLLDGLKHQNGPRSLRLMRAAGQVYIDHAKRLDEPPARIDPQPRPAPAPPRSVRPKAFTVTEIQRLIRDPYAIYARHVLKLNRLDPLRTAPDARVRGIVFHEILEEAFCLDADFSNPAIVAGRLRDIAGKHFEKLPWPGVAVHWYGHLDSIADQLATEECARRILGHPVALELRGRIGLPGTGFSIRGKADRIDRLEKGRLVIYDYKTGTPPSAHVVRHFDRQLPIEAVMAELGGFEGLVREKVSHVTHIGLGRTPVQVEMRLDDSGEIDFRTETILGELVALLSGYDNDTKGYPSRRAMEKVRYDGDYDHLARFGEWDETTSPTTESLP